MPKPCSTNLPHQPVKMPKAKGNQTQVGRRPLTPELDTKPVSRTRLGRV